MRKAIVKKFKEDKRFSKLFKREILTDLLPSIIKDDDTGTITDKKAALDTFSSFATYFTGFHQNRENLYSDEAKATAISNRIVNENFPKFYANVKTFEDLQKNFPDNYFRSGRFPKKISKRKKALRNFQQGQLQFRSFAKRN